MDGTPAAIPGHNAVLVLLGCFLALLGWLGLNCAGAVLFAGAAPEALAGGGHRYTLAAAAAALTAAAITRARFGRPDASLCANGWVAGLVAAAPPAPSSGRRRRSSPDWCPARWYLLRGVADIRLGVDDPAGSISVPCRRGIWGVLALGIFARFPGDSGQFTAQLVGVATLLGFVLPLTYCLNWLLNRFYRQRCRPRAKRQGMDLYELGAGAYPEFVIHREDHDPGVRRRSVPRAGRAD